MATQSSTTANIDIDYIQKDFSSTVDALISFANVNYGPGTSANRLWTNFNVDSFSRNWLEIVAYVADTFFFYFDVQATQAYLQTATVRSAVLDIAKQFGFVPAGATSASGNATFTFIGAGTLPRGFRVRASNGLEFYLTTDLVANSAGNFTGTVIQGTLKTEQFNATGLQNEEVDLVGPNVIRDLANLNLQDITPQVSVNGNDYTLVDTLIRNNGTDAPPVKDSLGNVIGGGGRVFTLELRPNGTPFLRFGDGIFGRKLLPSELITVKYRTGGGSGGNISEQTLTTLVDDSAIVTGVTNATKFSGGADEQSIEQLRQLIPASLRTLDRAVAEQDYSDLLLVNFTEVLTASTEVNTTDPGIDLNIYVVPRGIGITKITDNTLLKSKLTSYLDRRKMVTVQFQILDAFGIDVLVGLELFISNTVSKSSIRNSINSILTSYFDLNTGGSSGAGIQFAEPILLKDITNLIKDVPGIERFEIKRLTYRPRVQKNVLGLTTSYINSEVQIFKNVEELEWLLGAAGTITRTSGTTVFSNTVLTAYTYDFVSGLIAFSSAVDLSEVSVGDSFRTPTGEVTQAITVADVANSLNNTYFTMADNVGPVRVWFNTGAGTPPAVPIGGRLIQVNISTNATAAQVATALKTTMDADSKYSATISSNTVVIVDEFGGTRTNVTDDGATGFTFSIPRQGAATNTDFSIISVDTVGNKLYIPTGQYVSTSVTTAVNGSVVTGATTYSAYKVFKKINATATNLSIDSITDNNLDLSVVTGTGVALSARILLDNDQVFLVNQYSGVGEFFLIDGAGNIWEITSNSSNTLTTAITAVNDSSITAVASGPYKIVKSLGSYEVVFNQNIFSIQYNTERTVFSIGAQFSNIGTIGDAFQISQLQDNRGNLGIAVDLVSYDAGTKLLRLNNSPDLQGVNSNYYLIDNTGQVFIISAADNRNLPSTFYEAINQDTSFALKSSGLGVQYAQGFKVPTSSSYAVVSFNLKKEGNILGNLVAKIVADDGSGLPDLSTVIATSTPVLVASIPESFTKTAFPFTTPPSLTPSTQYHLVVQGDAAYTSSQVDNLNVFDNTGLVGFTYNGFSGIVQYASVVNLSAVSPGNYFRDGAGALFKIVSVDDSTDRITLSPGLTVNNTVTTNNDGAVFERNNVYVGADQTTPTYIDGKASRYDGSVWANDTQGPLANRWASNTDFIFSVEGPKTVNIDSNLTPALGPGATLSERYYDDEEQISLILGIASGLSTAATDVNAIGRGTVNSIANSKVDNFVFRSSRFADDIVNLRLNEIPQLSENDINIQIFGGVS
jgi:hypothetical protein